MVHTYRRTTARRPLSRATFLQIYGFAYFFAKWRRDWRRLRAEGAAMEARDWDAAVNYGRRASAARSARTSSPPATPVAASTAR